MERWITPPVGALFLSRVGLLPRSGYTEQPGALALGEA
jgi:hypothetical protein